MIGLRSNVVRLCVVALALALGLAAWQVRPVSGQGAVVRVVAPSTWPPGGGIFEVRIEAEGVTNLAAFQFKLAFDPAVLGFDGVEATPFLGSTGRTVSCWGGELLPPQHDIFFLGCGTLGGAPPGPAGSGVLAIARFHPVGTGPSPLTLSSVELADPLAEDIPATVVQGSVIVGTSAATAVPTATPVGATAIPGAPTSTPGAPTLTAVPGGPTPTPTPLPPGYEAVSLATGCNPVASTYPDSTPIQTIADAVGPSGILTALWEFEQGTWLGYSPQFPEVSDLTEKDFLAVVFICVNAPGDFSRPVV